MKRHALLIGVDLYDDERITPLRYAGDDAWALAGAFVERCRFDEVIVLSEAPDTDPAGPPAGVRHGGRPTVKNIIDHLRRLATHLRDDSLFVFGFSGHGVEDNGREEAYLYAADSLADHHTVNSLPVGTLRDLLGRLPTRWQVLLLDACRNDPRAGKGDTDNPLGDVLAKNLVGFARNGAGTDDRHTAFLSACRRGQRAHEWPDFQHGVCSHYLLQGLAGPAWSGGRLTIRGLAHHAKTGMEGWQRAAGLQQEPWFEQSGTEDIVLGEQDTALLATAAEARAARAQGEAAALAGAAAAAETRLQRLLTAEATARQEEAAAALARKAEAERREQAAAASAAAHRAKMEELAAQIREIEGRLGRSETAVNDGVGVLEQLTALLDEQERLAAERQRLETEAAAERQRRAEQEREEAERRERERQAREAEMARLAAAERERTLAERKATFEKGYAAYQRIAQSSLPAEAKRNAWLDLCRRVKLGNQPEPVKLAWTGDQVQVERSILFTDYSQIRPFENSLGMKFVPVVTSGDGKESVLFSVWETRVADYAAYAAANAGVSGEWKDPGFPQDQTHPVVKVSWEDAQGFCAWLTEKERQHGRIGLQQRYRLPTDAEWSWAVGIGAAEERAGKGRSPQAKQKKIAAGSHPWAYPWGKDWPPPKGVGNYHPSLKVDDYEYTSPVGSFGANAQGLYDLGGNVWEWIEDCYGGKSGSRGLRGGSWGFGHPSVLLSSFRHDGDATYFCHHYGFRVVMSGAVR
jgi:hypothetical protein